MDKAEFQERVRKAEREARINLRLPSISLEIDSTKPSGRDCYISFIDEDVEYTSPYDAIKAARGLIGQAKRLADSLQRDIERVQFLTS